MTEKIPLIIIAGPTGIGKSYVGMNLAQQIKTDLISADSRQVYNEFNIGTAKPTIEEQELIKHHLIDVCEPTKRFTTAEYLELTQPVIENVYKSGKIPMLVGGTGLYIKSLIEGFSIPKVEPLQDFRENLKQEANLNGNNELYERAKQIDPVSMEKIHQNDLFRIIRVLEIYESTGKPMSELIKKETEPVYDITYIGLNIEREKLYERIGNRVDEMLSTGLIDEVKYLINKYGENLPLLDTINYREVREYIRGNLTFEETSELMKKDTRNFAKRQLTWFRNDPNIIWKDFEKKEDSGKIIDYILNNLNKKYI